jgi:cytochrome-b5 reductase
MLTHLLPQLFFPLLRRAGRKGRLTREVVEEVLPKPSADTFVLVCGPPAFNGLAAKFLTQLGYDEHMFHIFA